MNTIISHFLNFLYFSSDFGPIRFLGNFVGGCNLNPDKSTWPLSGSGHPGSSSPWFNLVQPGSAKKGGKLKEG